MSNATQVAEPPKRRWCQYSLRSLFVVVTLSAIPCGWLGIEVRKAQEQKAAVDALVNSGYEVYFDYQYDVEGKRKSAAQIPGLPWLRSILGDDLFRTVHSAKFTDSFGLEHVEVFSKLENLVLDHTGLMDAGLVHLQGLTQLKYLSLEGTSITDAGLEILTRLTQLKALDLTGTKVTDAGVADLQQALPGCHIICR